MQARRFYAEAMTADPELAACMGGGAAMQGEFRRRKKLTLQQFSELVQATGLMSAAGLAPKALALVFAQSQSEDFSKFEGARQRPA